MRQISQYTDISRAVSSTATYTTFDVWPVGGLVNPANIDVTNEGTAALADFKVQIQEHAGAAYRDYVGGTVYSSTSAVMPYVGHVTPATLAGGSATSFHIYFGACNAVRFAALAGTTNGATTISVRATGADV